LTNLPEALTLIQMIIEKWPQDWEAYYLAAGNYFSQNKDQEAVEMIDKSLERKETFDNIISKAQMLCIWGKEYQPWVEKARKMDKKRLENFMQHHWVGNMDQLKISHDDKEILVHSRSVLSATVLTLNILHVALSHSPIVGPIIGER